MAHKNQLSFFIASKKFYPHFFEGKKVLEVGSLNINGTIRNYFNNCDYVGCDIAEGDGVDVSLPGQMLDFPSEHFDFVISTESFEHNPFWVETLSNMLRMMKADGMLMITCASFGRGEHGTVRTTPDTSPLTSAVGWTYYKNLSGNDFKIIDLQNWLSSYLLFEGGSDNDLVLVGFGRGSSYKIDEDYERNIRVMMRYTFRSFLLMVLNRIVGNRYFQQLYVLTRNYVPFLLRSKPIRKNSL